MPTPPIEQLRVVRYAPGWGFAALEWEAALRGVDWNAPPDQGGPRRLKVRRSPGLPGRDDCPVWLATLELPGRRVAAVLKVRRLDGWRPILQSWLGLGKGHRQWRGAELLARHGFAAAPCLGLLRGRNAAEACELLILEGVPGKTVLEHLADGDLGPAGEQGLASAVGRLIARTSAAGLVNRDVKPSNLLVRVGKRGPEIIVLDTVAVARRRRAARAKARMLRDLLLEPLGCGLPMRRTLMMRTLIASIGQPPPHRRRSIRNALWREVEALIAAHGDPKPIDDPLG